MTRNQIEYWRLKETNRANLANEQHQRDVLAYNYATLAEQTRANKAREAETNRSNLANELQNRINSNRNLEMSKNNLLELRRSNKEREANNRAITLETNRANMANEAIRIQTNYLTLMSNQNQARMIDEQSRSNRANEALRSSQLVETNRSNLANELLAAQRNAEQFRSNSANERLRLMQHYETQRSNIARETETHRSNVVNEALKAAEVGTKVMRTVADLSNYSKQSKIRLRK